MQMQEGIMVKIWCPAYHPPIVHLFRQSVWTCHGTSACITAAATGCCHYHTEIRCCCWRASTSILLAAAIGGCVHSSCRERCWTKSAAITPYAAAAWLQHSHDRLFLCPNPKHCSAGPPTGCTLFASWAMRVASWAMRVARNSRKHLQERVHCTAWCVLHWKVALISSA